jgi:predicted ATPase
MGPSGEGPFAELLAGHRGAARLTQEELASRAGLSPGAVSLLERGARTAPRRRTVARLAAALRLSPAESQAFAAAARRRSAARVPRFPVPPELRISATAFFGRERELAGVRVLLRRPDVRLLTLTGSPGVGKTRLALEVAAAVADDYRDGAAIVALGSLTDPTQVMRAVQQALGLVEARNRPALETVATHCRDRHRLLLLDNLEHLLAAGPELAELLDRCPELQMLVTSRAAARIRVEHELAVPPLRLPSAGEERAAETLRSVPAVALFLDRAAAARPSFRLTAENAGSVAAICRRLDGVPLALELAAPWVRLLTPPEILDQLDRQLELLVDGPRDLPERQRTMRATLAWSCELLEAEPRALLRRLSVFRGGAPLDALDRVCQAAGALRGGVLQHLAVLVDHSLVGRHEAAGGEPRVTMLETVREYGSELLAAAGDEEATAIAHLEHCAGLAARSHRGMRTGAQASWLDRLRRELDNVRAALGWAVGHGRTDAGLCLAGAMWPFWDFGGHRQEGLSWLCRLLAAGGQVEPGARAEALKAAGFLSWQLGALEQSIAQLSESQAIFQELGDRRGVAEAVRGLGNATGAGGSHREAIPLLERAVGLLRDLDERPLLATALTSLGVYVSRDGDRRRATTLYEEALTIQRELDNSLGMALCLTNLGHQAQIAADLPLAQTRLEEAVGAARRLDAPFYLAAALANLGDVFRERGEAAVACECYREALALFAGLGDRPGVAGCLRCLAWGAWTAGQPARAARLYGAAEALRPAAIAYDADDDAFHEQVRSPLRQQLGEGAFAAAHEAGRRLSLDQAAAEASA